MTQRLFIPGRPGDWPWILCYLEPTPDRPPQYFLVHGRNYEKYKNRKGVRIMGHIFGKEKASEECTKLNEAIRKATGGKKPNPKSRLILPPDYEG